MYTQCTQKPRRRFLRRHLRRGSPGCFVGCRSRTTHETATAASAAVTWLLSLFCWEWNPYPFCLVGFVVIIIEVWSFIYLFIVSGVNGKINLDAKIYGEFFEWFPPIQKCMAFGSVSYYNDPCSQRQVAEGSCLTLSFLARNSMGICLMFCCCFFGFKARKVRRGVKSSNQILQGSLWWTQFFKITICARVDQLPFFP